MIKNYDEALKTLNYVRNYLSISRADNCVEELDKVARYFINEKHKENPNLSECIKEWEKRGYLCFLSKEPKLLDISNLEEYSVIKIGLENKHYIKVDSVLYSSFIPITFEEHNLIHKTLKALEGMKDE